MTPAARAPIARALISVRPAAPVDVAPDEVAAVDVEGACELVREPVAVAVMIPLLVD